MDSKNEKYAIGKEVFDKVDTIGNIARKYGTTYINVSNWMKSYAKSVGQEKTSSSNYESMKEKELRRELMKKDIEIARLKKRLCSERGWGKKGLRYYTRLEYQIVAELSYRYDDIVLCKAMNVSRSGFYKWQKRVNHPSHKDIAKGHDVMLFLKYHEQYPSHGYRWLNAKIRLDSGQVMSNQNAHKCCKYAGIKSKLTRYRYKKNTEKGKTYPNIILRNLNIQRPLCRVVNDVRPNSSKKEG